MSNGNVVILYSILTRPEGYILIGDNKYDYASDKEIIDLLRKHKKVMLCNYYQQSIDWLPNEITHLIIGTNFNKPLNNLPASLKYLAFEPDGYYNLLTLFNNRLDNLPHGLEELQLAICGNNTYLGENLPSTLKKLYIFGFGSKNMINMNNFPDSIEFLYLDKICLEIDKIDRLPSNLKVFESNDLNCVKDKYELFKTKFPNVIINLDGNL